MRRLGLLVVCLSMAVAAHANIDTGFETPDYNGSAGGTMLTGQQGWYNPVSGSADFSVYTYAGNTWAVPQNPTGGSQFVGGRMAGNAAFARAQHDIDWTASNVWTVAYDICGKYTGTLPTADNLGSFSMQPSTTARFWQTVFQWMDPNTATQWKTGYFTQEYPSTGVPVIPGPAWQNLAVDHWYRESTTFRLSDNLIMSVSITDLSNGQTSTVDSPGWHLVSQSGQPTGFRFFTGGGAGTNPPGNLTAWDNLRIVPEPGSLLVLALGWGVLALRRGR